jgi:hypothetical protein
MWNIVTDVKIDKKYKILFFVLVGMVFILFGIYERIKEKQNDLYLIEIANQTNQDLPMIINAETRLDYTVALSKNKFGYFYTLMLETVNEIDIEEFEKYIRPNLVINAKTNHERFNFGYLKVNLVYFFKDKNGNDLINLEINYKEYK